MYLVLPSTRALAADGVLAIEKVNNSSQIEDCVRQNKSFAEVPRRPAASTHVKTG
jgi:hypothetical protein